MNQPPFTLGEPYSITATDWRVRILLPDHACFAVAHASSPDAAEAKARTLIQHWAAYDFLLALARNCEWSGRDGLGVPVCPLCLNKQADGHSKMDANGAPCPLGALPSLGQPSPQPPKHET